MSDQKVSCEEVHEHICDNLDEELNSPNCKAIKMHLIECPDCAAYLKSMKTAIYLYKEYPSPQLPESAKRAIEEHIKKIIYS